MGEGERGPCGGGGRGPDSELVRAAPCSHQRPARHRGGQQSACIVRAPRESARPRPRHPAQRRRRLRREQAAARASLRAGTPSAPHSAFASSQVPSLGSPPLRDPRPGCRGGEGSKQVLEAQRTTATELGSEPPARRSSALRPARRALPPLRLAGRQAGHRPLALPPARPGHASSVATANPPLALVRLPRATQSTRSPLNRPVSSATHYSSSTASHLSPPIP